jgi:hypothetical protein
MGAVLAGAQAALTAVINNVTAAHPNWFTRFIGVVFRYELPNSLE